MQLVRELHNEDRVLRRESHEHDKPDLHEDTTGSDDMPVTEQSKHIGTTKITENGSFQLSYFVANTRKTKMAPGVSTGDADQAGRHFKRANRDRLLLHVGNFGPLIREAEAVGQAVRLPPSPCRSCARGA